MERARTFDQRRTRCVQQFVADHVDAVIVNCRYVLPRRDVIRLLGVCFRSRRRPSEDNYIWLGRCYLRFGNFLTAGDNHFATANAY